MKITICGSIAFIQEMASAAKELETLGHEVKFPPVTKTGEFGQEIPSLEYYAHKKEAATNPDDWIWKQHDQPIRAHFDKVVWSEAILVLNHDKNGISGYVGPNTLMEMGLAFHLQKPIFLLNGIPEVAWKEEILGMKPVLIDGNLTRIRL